MSARPETFEKADSIFVTDQTLDEVQMALIKRTASKKILKGKLKITTPEDGTKYCDFISSSNDARKITDKDKASDSRRNSRSFQTENHIQFLMSD